ncbi:hypothetical protein [Aquibacillus kalidii]|uniref:hypothetical protein n=1 Tax=Aquibacillus kalidii TaxID=2762597 RepID=UPI00164642C5|nr:hypothetical protein [Aquibacillus kalidii]
MKTVAKYLQLTYIACLVGVSVLLILGIAVDIFPFNRRISAIDFRLIAMVLALLSLLLAIISRLLLRFSKRD